MASESKASLPGQAAKAQPEPAPEPSLVENLPFVSIKKKNYSQYDLVKIKVHLKDHFYVFSRFLMSRVLTLIKVNDKDSIKITLDIKKHFVENQKTEVTQEELE